MLKCKLEHSIDCRGHWDIKRTSHGSCISLNVNKAYDLELAFGGLKKNFYGKPRHKTPKLSKETLELQFGNKINTTMKAAIQRHVHYPDPHQIKNLDLIIGFNKSDNTFGWNGFNNALHLYYSDYDEEYFSRVHSIGLVPSLDPTLTFVQTLTKLLGAPYKPCNSEPDYTQRKCQVHEYMARVLDKCGCYPR